MSPNRTVPLDDDGGLDMRAGRRLIVGTLFDAPAWGALVVLCALAGGAVSLAFPAILAHAIDAALRGDALGADLVVGAAAQAVGATPRPRARHPGASNPPPGGAPQRPGGRPTAPPLRPPRARPRTG